MAELHDRKPVILEPETGRHGWARRRVIRDHPAPNGTLRTWPADRRVGSTRNNGAEQIKPTEIAM
jgi:putative SOS response-associated peptidase YedK